MTVPPRLEVVGVTRRFGSGDTEVVAVRDVHLRVSPGEVVLIMGPSGSGKSTLLMMVGALLRPSAGSVKVDGVEITKLSERRLPEIRLRKIGFIFQDFNLLSSLPARDNVAIVAQLAGVDRREARRRAERLLTLLGLGARLTFLPEKLSGGEKQRVAIARALINEPALLLADEPTANLHSKQGVEILHLLQSMAKERRISLVVASHDERIREIADRVLWLEDGKLTDTAALRAAG